MLTNQTMTKSGIHLMYLFRQTSSSRTTRSMTTVTSTMTMMMMTRKSDTIYHRSLTLYRGYLKQMQMQYPQSLRYKSTIPANTTTTTSTTRKTVMDTTTTNHVSSMASTSSNTNAYITSIMTSLIAAIAGVLTVAGVTTLVEQTTALHIPKFDINGQRYDTNTYIGRFCSMLLQCDPYLLLYSNQQIYNAKAFVDNYVNMLQQQQMQSTKDKDDTDVYDALHSQQQQETELSDEEKKLHHQLWESKRIYESAMNDSGMIIPMPFRMCGYVPYNGPICVAMVSSTSTSLLLFWSWINQSQNALVNYYNRSNSSEPMDISSFVQSYTIAVSSALVVAFGLATMIQKKFTPQRAQVLLRYVAFPSAVIASSLNCYIVRSPEIQTGIPLYDEDGNDVMKIASQNNNIGMNHDFNNNDQHNTDGNTNTTETSSMITSQIAAKCGVYATTASRAILQAPVYFLPPLLVSTIFSRIVQTSPTIRLIPITTYLLLCSFGFGLPAAVAIYPQKSTIVANQVEYQFQQLINPKTQQPYTIFYYDKGL